MFIVPVGRTDGTDGTDGDQKCLLINFHLRYILHQHVGFKFWPSWGLKIEKKKQSRVDFFWISLKVYFLRKNIKDFPLKWTKIKFNFCSGNVLWRKKGHISNVILKVFFENVLLPGGADGDHKDSLIWLRFCTLVVHGK